MLTTANPYDSKIILATLDGLDVDGKGAHFEQTSVSSIEPRARLLHRLYRTLR